MGSPLRFLLLAPALSLASCPVVPDGTDLFVNAIGAAPGGSFLSVWGGRFASTPRLFVAGGFVGVDRAMLGAMPAGRLVEYTGPGTFRTRCTTDQPLWWVTGVEASDNSYVLFAAGEGGRVLRYDGTTCTTLDTSALGTGANAPTFWGLYARSATDVWLVGGSALPTGPRGVLVHYDGASFTQDSTVPAAARDVNLYKIDRASDGNLLVVGESATVLALAPGSSTWTSLSTAGVARADDNRLFTVSCGTSGRCQAVGGAGSALWLQLYPSDTNGAVSNAPVAIDDLPGLNGVYVQDYSNTFVVGVNGLTLHYNGRTRYVPPTPRTTATLHSVGGSSGIVLAVGGELGLNSPAQRGVLLVRGDASRTFTLDGTSYTATGNLFSSLGGAGQH